MFAHAWSARGPETDRNRSIDHLLILLAPLGASASALVFAHMIAHPVKVPYSTVDAVITQLRTKPIYTWLLAWFTTFGPALGLAGKTARRSHVGALYQTRND